ncbi:MAG TPA: hypothetical protein VLG76_03495 [Rhabdochlamydiaceae bacterium]|nr:hypothetical protein [Rhabdochlamydiaceae bacterium]
MNDLDLDRGLDLQLLFRDPNDGFIEGDYVEEEGLCSICQYGADAVAAIVASGYFHRNRHQCHGQCLRQWLATRSTDPIDNARIFFIQTRDGVVEPVLQRRLVVNDEEIQGEEENEEEEGIIATIARRVWDPLIANLRATPFPLNILKALLLFVVGVIAAMLAIIAIMFIGPGIMLSTYRPIE